jgi:hypothetical protein
MTRPAKLLAGLLGVIAIVGTLTVADNRAQPAERDHSTGRQIVDALSQGNVVVPREQVFFEAKRGSVNVNVYDAAKQATQQAVVERIRSLRVVEEYDGTITVNFFPAREVVKTELSGGVTESRLVSSSPIAVVRVKHPR